MKEYPVHRIDISRGERLAYRRAGVGAEKVLLVHGNMSSGVHWQTTMEQLEPYFTVFAPDMRGFGDSSYNAPFDTLHDLALDLAQFCDAVGLDRFWAVGWSTGGGVALELAADLPERVHGLVLLDSVPPTGYPIFKKDENGRPILTQLLKTKEEIAADPVQVAPALNAYANNDRATMRAIWDAVIYNLRHPPSQDYERYLDAIMQQRNLVDVDYALLNFNMTDSPTGSAPGSGRLARVKGPVYIFHGAKDLVVPYAWGEATARLLGNRARPVTFGEAGHSVLTDAPEAFFVELLKALRGSKKLSPPF